MTTTSKQKKRSAVIAAVLAVAVLLTGTYAWQSISQQAKNETITSANVGGRLHDDFDGKNKDVYVENFTDPENGAPILARIRLDEYMETGMEAGMNRTKDKMDGSGGKEDVPMADRKVTPLVADTNINDVTTWKAHKPETDVKLCTLGTHDYWEWTLGGQTTFMPTFNKNKDSLKADINGTIEGKDGDGLTVPGNRYSDYVDYSLPANATKTGDEVYDADANDIEEETPAEGTNIKTVKNVTHTAKKTQNGSVISMAEWESAGKKLGQYWVYDTDGWAYWAMPIQPGEATGLLLNQIEMTGKTDEDCYYAINVVGQFASLKDYGKAGTEGVEGTGFFAPTSGEAPTTNAQELLKKIAETKAAVTVTAAGGATSVAAGGAPLKFSGKISYDAQDITATDTLTWTVEGATSEETTIDAEGNLTVAKLEGAEKLTVNAKSKLYGIEGTSEVTVDRTFQGKIAAVKAGTTQTVNVDGIDWYVLVNEDNKKALLWSKDMIPSWGTGGRGPFGATETACRWMTTDGTSSIARTWCNDTFLPTLTNLNTIVMDTTLKTRERIDSTNFIESTDKVFFLSEADLFGTFNDKGETVAEGELPVLADDYTYNGKVLVPDVNMRKCDATVTDLYWLRSPRIDMNNLALGTVRGLSHRTNYNNDSPGARPALWVNLDS